MNALEFLIQDHRRQQDFLCQISSAQDTERRDLYAKFRENLIKHVNIEEEIFYPRLKKIPSFEEPVLEALEEHNLCMQLLQELDDLDPQDKLFKAKLKLLTDLTLKHIEAEEQILFPMVRELASTEYLSDMGAQMRVHHQHTDPEKVLYPDQK